MQQNAKMALVHKLAAALAFHAWKLPLRIGRLPWRSGKANSKAPNQSFKSPTRAANNPWPVELRAVFLRRPRTENLM